MKYYSTIKRNKVMTYATKWMKLENVIANERNHSQRMRYGIILFMWNVQNKEIDSDGKQRLDGNAEELLIACFFWGEKFKTWKYSKNDDDNGCRYLWIYYKSLKCTLIYGWLVRHMNYVNKVVLKRPLKRTCNMITFI